MVRIVFIFILSLTAITNVNAQENISLVTPYDTDTIDTKYPLFTWFYMSPDFGNNRSYYRIIIVELKKEQSAEAGIVVNPPLVKMDHLNGTQLIYPYDAKELEYGHRYGWQIQRIQDNVIADKSEAWEFILPLPIEPNYMKYATLKTKNDGALYEATGGKVFFKMDEKYLSNELKYFVYDKNWELLSLELKGEERERRLKHNGSNFYELDLGGMVSSGHYNLLVLDQKGRKYTLNFIVL